MEFEVWWLLGIPAFFALGWLAARIDLRQVINESRTLPRGYYKGLNYLLADNPDKAIDSFIEIVKYDPEAVEMHFALGNLFRRRGEIERAIRMHQNMLLRADLPTNLRCQAHFELGHDFLKAGLFDRAEENFRVLLDESSFSSPARLALLEIYQREKEWQRAIEAANELKQAGAGARQSEIAQFYCELAQDALINSRKDEVAIHIDSALKIDRTCVRALVILGSWELAQGDTEAALATWRRIEHLSIPHVALIAQRLMEGYYALGRAEEGLVFLKYCLEQASSIDLLDVVFKAILEQEGVEAATQLVADELRRTPTLLGLDKMLEAQLMSAKASQRPELALIKSLVHGYAQKLTRYQCTRCGFRVRQYYWQCPGCSHWDSYPPRRTEELNPMEWR